MPKLVDFLTQLEGKVIGEEGIKTDINFSLEKEDYLYMTAAILVGGAGAVLIGNLLTKLFSK